MKEYRKCAHLLEPITAEITTAINGGGEAGRISALRYNCLYLKNHALFLVSEQAKEEEILETGGSTDKIICSPIINQQLSKIEAELEVLFEARHLDALNCYLLGLVYKERNKKAEAREAFIRALNHMPLLWSAWLELGTLIT